MPKEVLNETDYINFYDSRRSETYADDYEKFKPEDYSYYFALRDFIKQYNLEGKKCLEIGSSGGYFQDFVVD
jgi:hypothetical protein